MATGTIKSYPKRGTFTATLSANTYSNVLEVTHSGNLPSNANKAVFTIINSNASANHNTRIYVVSGNILMYTDVAQTYTVAWDEF